MAGLAVKSRPAAAIAGVWLAALLFASGCTTYVERRIETTGYCSCSECTHWERGFPDFWNKYVDRGKDEGRPYDGRTASGTKPRSPQPGLVSVDTLTHPWMLPIRLVFPWLWLAHDGTVAADTRYYAFGTRVWVPGWGYGRVEDRGGAIKGPRRFDLYFDSHRRARRWGRKDVQVWIYD